MEKLKAEVDKLKNSGSGTAKSTVVDLTAANNPRIHASIISLQLNVFTL